jgi:TPR repeat protein
MRARIGTGLAVLIASSGIAAAIAGPAEDFRAAASADRRGDYATEFALLRPLAEWGFTEAQYNLALLYDNGRGTQQDHVAALSWYRKAAEQNLANAQTQLGVILENAEGVPQDYDAALSWYRKAAASHYPEAEHRLGLMYANGRGVPPDATAAAAWYRRAADQGNAGGQYDLGLSYASGSGVPADDVEAHKWLNLAAAHLSGGHNEDGHDAVGAREHLAVRMTRRQLAEAQKRAAEWTPEGAPPEYGEPTASDLKAAAQGVAEAQYAIGVMYEKGVGVPQNYVQAYKWLALAALRLAGSAAESRNAAAADRDALARKMTRAQLTEAEKLTDEWKVP